MFPVRRQEVNDVYAMLFVCMQTYIGWVDLLGFGNVFPSKCSLIKWLHPGTELIYCRECKCCMGVDILLAQYQPVYTIRFIAPNGPRSLGPGHEKRGITNT